MAIGLWVGDKILVSGISSKPRLVRLAVLCLTGGHIGVNNEAVPAIPENWSIQASCKV